MASLQQRSGTYRVIFRFHGKQHFVLIGRVSPAEAEAKAAQIEYLLMRLKQGLIGLPPGIDIAEFVQDDGKTPSDAQTTTARGHVDGSPATGPARPQKDTDAGLWPDAPARLARSPNACKIG
jgi:hypothetical protein